jgi:hypothetical protein
LSEKLDGVRAYWDGKQFISRLGNAYLAPDWFIEGLPEFALDGELFAGRGRFQHAVSVARRMDKGDGWRSLAFVIFDAPALSHGFEDRIKHLEDHFGARPWPQAKVLEHRVCTGHDDLTTELRRVEDLGGEGLMLRRPGSRYVAGRSDTLLKVKSFLDTEARVVGHQAGTGKHKGRLGALLVELADGTRFKVGTGLSDAERGEPPEVGDIVTVRYQELTDAGVPRFPSYIGARAAIAALSGPQDEVARMNASFKARHDFFVAGLNALPGIRCRPGEGTFYAFADVSGAMRQLGIADDTSFCDYLLNEALVAGVPGSGFGAPGHLRLSFAVSMQNLEHALQRIGAALASPPGARPA